MSLLQALVLGLVQGLTEFLPVSSSGHLTLVPFIIGWDEPSIAFDVALHVGTLAAVTWVFRERIAVLARTALGWSRASAEERAMLTLVAIGTIPAAILGAALQGPVGDAFERPVLVAFLLGVTGYFLMSTETVYEHEDAEPRSEEQIKPRDAAVIGLAQAVSILPGISRSGSTIGAAMRLGLSRTAATRFSFLLSIPIIVGAVLAQIPDMLDEGLGGGGSFLVGILASGVSGFYAVRWFLGVVERRGLRPFGAYCFFAMTAGLVTALARG